VSRAPGRTRLDIPALPSGQRALVLAALAALSAIAWAYLMREARAMDSVMDAATMMRAQPRDAVGLGLLFVMWSVMMVGMMLPSAAPTVLLYAAAVRRSASSRLAVMQIGIFAAGYLLVWSGFSVVATAVQAGLERLALLSPTMVSASPVFGAALLAGAGVYQLSPLKEVCVEHCQSPFAFFLQHWRAGPTGALRMGLAHGWYCVGCCWLLMGLLFVGGVMNLLWVAALAGFILLEKAIVRGLWLSRLSGVGLVLCGGYLLYTAVVR